MPFLLAIVAALFISERIDKSSDNDKEENNPQEFTRFRYGYDPLENVYWTITQKLTVTDKEN